jgi:uncharacterized protein YaiE (UPF0345 family)
MFKTNEYFEGNVKSLSFQGADGPATIGVMAKGEYEFGTSTIEGVDRSTARRQRMDRVQALRILHG